MPPNYGSSTSVQFHPHRSHYLYIEHGAISILAKSTSLRHMEAVPTLHNCICGINWTSWHS